MFPPPGPWKAVGTADPEREHIGFTSRFFMRSPLRVPAFFRYMRRASIFVQYKVLGKDLPLRWSDAIERQSARLG